MEDLPDQPPRAQHFNSSWTEAEVETLKRCCTEGLTASQSAAVLGKTRNAVIGKISRVAGASLTPQKTGRAPRPSRGQGLRKPRTNWSARHAGPPTERIAALQEATAQARASANRGPPTMMRQLQLLDLEHHDCRWPIGDVGDADFFFCGNPKLVETPYCGYHSHIGYQPGARRRP